MKHRRLLPQALLCLLVLAAPAVGGPITISEVLYDAIGTDDGSTFIELFGPPGFSLSGYVLEGVNGKDGSVTHRVDLSALSIPFDRFLVIADLSRSGVTLVPEADFTVRNLDLQNGPDSLRLLSAGSVADALGYGTFTSGQVFAGEGTPAPGVAPGSSLARRFADGDTDVNLYDFLERIPTPGSGPTMPVVAATPEPATIGMLGLGLVLVAAVRRRYSRKQ